MCTRKLLKWNPFCGSEHDVGGPQFRNRTSYRPPRGRMYSEHVHQRLQGAAAGGFSTGSSSRFVDEDGDVSMSNGQDGAFQGRL